MFEAGFVVETYTERKDELQESSRTRVEVWTRVKGAGAEHEWTRKQ